MFEILDIILTLLPDRWTGRTKTGFVVVVALVGVLILGFLAWLYYAPKS